MIYGLARGIADRPWLGAAAAIALLGATYSFRLTDSPGFSGDEAYLAEPALQLARTGTMSCPGYGPSHHHQEIWLYQAPLHIALAGGLLVFLPLGLATLRLLSVLLALLGGVALVALARSAKASWAGATVGAVVFLADPLTVERARLFRFDFLGLLLFLLGLLVATRRGARGSLVARLARPAGLSGLLAGLAVSCYAGYLLLAPAGLLWGLLRRPGLSRRARWAAWWCAGWALGTLPFAALILLHRAAFLEQFVWEATALAGPPLGLRGNLAAELAKYAALYRLAPLFPLLVAASFLLLALRRPAGRRGREGLRALVLALSCLLPIALFSGHHPWYQLLALPSLGLCAGLAFDALPFARLRTPVAAAALALVLAALGTGPRLYAATRGAGLRDPLLFEEKLAHLIPDGARVHGDYTLWFIAQRHGWKFTMETYENDSSREVLLTHPDFLVEEAARPTRVRARAPESFLPIAMLSADLALLSRRLPSQVAPALTVYAGKWPAAPP